MIEAILEGGLVMTVQDILAAASQLSREDQLQVAIGLLESLKISHWVAPQNVEVEVGKKCSLHDLLSLSPLSRLDFEAERSGVRVFNPFIVGDRDALF